MILAEVKEDLEEEGMAFNARLPVGTMIEVPSAAIMAEQLAREVDFFSIGTNDLIQYTLAADRNNEAVACLYNAGDPAVLRLIETVVQGRQKERHRPSTVCGEMSGEPLYTMLLLGLGLRQLSVTPHNIPEIKKFIRSVSVDAAVETAREALRLETARDVNNYLREQTRRILPRGGELRLTARMVEPDDVSRRRHVASVASIRQVRDEPTREREFALSAPCDPASTSTATDRESACRRCSPP